MLYTASFYAMEDWQGQVYRVSRGHPRGRKTLWETLPFLNPSRILLQTYQSGDLDFTGLETEYRKELASSRQESQMFQEWHGWSAFSKQSRVRSPWDGRPSSHS